MNFTAYIQQQKLNIRRRHLGEMFLMKDGEIIPLKTTETLLCELDAMRGLNKRERTDYSRM